MGPMSGVLFLVGVIMFFVGRDHNNDDFFDSTYFFCGRRGSDDPEFDRIRLMIIGILLIIAAVVMWVYIAVKGDPIPIPDYNSLMNRNSSQ